MRRYFVRFAVAFLTFAIGVAISLALGLFKPNFQNQTFAYRERRGCGKRFAPAPPRVLAGEIRSGIMSVNNLPDQPLTLQILSTDQAPNSAQRQIRLLVENRSDKSVDDYTVDWDVSSDVGRQGGVVRTKHTLEPRSSEVITIDCNAGGFLSIRLESASFDDGSGWYNGLQAGTE